MSCANRTESRILTYLMWRQCRSHARTCKTRLCFHLLPSTWFCKRSAEFYNLPPAASRSKYCDRQFVELLHELALDERAGIFSTDGMSRLP
jgi:hypothetical protein